VGYHKQINIPGKQNLLNLFITQNAISLLAFLFFYCSLVVSYTYVEVQTL